ncbi:RNA-directed DNA polymerase, eukaryota, reverse transcriptase zinc-binding domain protein [Tanacetum coccineum]
MRSQRQPRVPLRYEDIEDVVLEEGEVESCNSGDSDEDVGLNFDGGKGVFGNADKENIEVQTNIASGCNTPNNTMSNGKSKDDKSNETLGAKLNEGFRIQNLNFYASMVKMDDVPKSLDFISTVITDNGNEVVIFKEELVLKGSEKWCLTVCGQFVGFEMHISELGYNIKECGGGKYGIDEIANGKNGYYMFKFKDEVGMNAVIEKGWMVKNKPLFVYKWSPQIGMKKVFGHENKKCKNGGADTNDNAEKHYDNVENRDQQNRNNEFVTQKRKRVQRNYGKLKKKVVEDIRNNANKYSVLNTLPEDNDQELRTFKERMVIDKFLNKKLQPTLREFITWSKDMIDYFKRKWDEMENEIEDVMEVNNGTTKITKDNEISGIKGRVMNDDSYRIKIGVCDMLETRLKSNKLQKAYDIVFQRWDWVSNMQECSKGCRIVSFYTFVYATNDGIDRRSLWKELIKEKRYVNGKPWCIAGDMNVTLKVSEHSCGRSFMTTDMVEFQECLNKIEIEDICKIGLHFTWTKNLQKTKDGDMTRILKKLDRVMTNEEFIKKFANAHAKFLPYIISDHTLSFLCIPTSVKKKAKAFRFSNYLTDKQEFLHIVKDKWSADIHGYPHTHILRNTKANLVKEFYEAEEDEEKFLFQQAKIKWLSDKDKNNSYFHKVLKGRNNRSKILKKAQLVQDIEDCSTLFQRRVQMVLLLLAIVGTDVCKAVREFFNSGRMLELEAKLLTGRIEVFPMLEDFSLLLLPKNQGGVGLKNLLIWNQVFLAKNVWNIAIKKDTLWVKWAYSIKLRGKNIWEISVDSVDSWGWKNLLIIIDLIRSNVKSIIGNGIDTSIWFNNWSSSSQLFQFLSYRDLYDARLKGDMKVSEMINNGQWRWPEEWDRYEKDMKFSVHTAYNDMTNQQPMVAWWKLICLCCQNSEDIKHLLFQCSFSKDLWTKVRGIADIRCISFDLMSIMQFLIDVGNSNNIKSIIRRTAFAACIYSIWQERNGRIFRKVRRSCDEVFKSTVDKLKHRLLGLTIKDSPAVRDTESKWGISCRKISSKKLQMSSLSHHSYQVF